MSSARPLALHRQALVRLLPLLVAVLALLHAARYAQEVAIPVVTDDSWYFLDAFVQPDLENRLSWREFFRKREQSDHSQPLHRVQLWLNTALYDLDFKVEALVGIAGMALCVLLLMRWMQRQRGIGPEREPLRLDQAAILALVPLCLASVNPREGFTWSLMTLFYLVLPILLLCCIEVTRLRPLRSFVWMWLLLLALDGAGVLGGAALCGALLLQLFKGGPRGRVLCTMLAILVAMLSYKLLYAWLLPMPQSAPASLTLWQQLLDPAAQVWRWFITPASASVAHYTHLQVLWPERVWQLQVLLGVLMLGLHALFWWSVLRKPMHALTVVAVALVLFSYGVVLGVIISRVPDYGTGYLEQQRYVVFYQLANLGLLLQWWALRLAQPPAPASRLQWLRSAAPLLVLAVFAGWQLHLSQVAWREAVYVREFSDNLAQTIYCLGEHPQLEQPQCPPNLQACGWTPGVRNRLVQLLREHQLNVYSEDFQRRHGISPDPARADICVPGSSAGKD